jgi:hypothetical protein
MPWPSQRSQNPADAVTKEDVKKRKEKEKAKLEAFVKNLFLRMRLQRWAFIPQNSDEALARNSLCTTLDIAFKDLMPLLLACELVKYEKRREGYNNVHQVNSKKWESFVAKQQNPILYYMTHQPSDENNKQLSACHFVSNGKPSDQKPKPIYPSKNQNLNAPNTPAWVMRPAKHGKNTRQKVKEIVFEMAKRKENVKNEKMSRGAIKHAHKNEQADKECREPPDREDKPPDLPRLCASCSKALSILIFMHRNYV